MSSRPTLLTASGLRDSGQLALAEQIRTLAHPSWRAVLEAPTGEGRQAAEVLFIGPGAGIHLELDSTFADFQAQLRSGHLKRDALQARLGIRLAFVLVVRDTARNRTSAQPHAAVIRQALPAGSREVVAAIRGGIPVERDGLLWLRGPRTSAIRI